MKVVIANDPQYGPIIRSILERVQGNSTVLDTIGVALFVLATDDDEPIGVMHAYQISDIRTYVNAVLLPEANKDPERNATLELVFQYLFNSFPDMQKLEVTIPVSDKKKTRMFSKLGFNREGVSKKSIRVDGELVDQTFMGRLR